MTILILAAAKIKGKFHENEDFCSHHPAYKLADLTVSKRPGTSFRIEIHFTVFNRFNLLFSFMKLVETS